MSDLRAAREDVLRRHWRRLTDNLERGLPGFLDALEAIDRNREHAAKPPDSAAGGTEAAPAVNHPPDAARRAERAPAARRRTTRRDT